MRYQQVCLESFGYCLPEQIVSSDEIERRLEPLYRRLRLPEGRLELMTGIQQRRVWPRGMLPSEKSVESGRHALEAADIDPGKIGALIHASVCRDHLEPATACRVHHELGLPSDCMIYDTSNACLGLMNGAVQIANMIELGQIQAGLVVGTEDSGPLMRSTLDELNSNESLTRSQIKLAVASLTIGSGSCAMLLVDRETSRTDNRLLGATVQANTRHHQLCHSGKDEAVGGGMNPLMETDSEALMREGIATGVVTFAQFLEELGWSPRDIDRSVCHQVGSAHRRMMLGGLDLNPDNDFATFKWLGNTGSVALPITMAIGCQAGVVQADEQVALLGIGSGINCLMLATHWQKSLVSSPGEMILPENLSQAATI
ncbi:MAG: 3-oxoacyl-ACP synthase III [Pirellulaceae bacterium]|nr:3-oxoacyl-ACP synthase III [Pirellulaceae bacterium]